MKKTYLLLIAAGLMSLAACNKSIEETVVEDDTVVSYTYIGATAKEDGTKGSIDGSTGDFTWNTGDQIAVWAGGYCVSEALGSQYNGLTDATFAFTGLTEADRANFAIYPASFANSTNYTNNNLVVDLPGSYTLSQLQGEVTPIPMIAVNVPNENLEFKQLCALLRLKVNSIPPSAKRLELDFAGNKVHGSFAVSLSSGAVTPGTSVIETAGSSADDIITITPDGDTFNNGAWLDGLVLNIPIPLGPYTTVKVSAFDALSGGNEILTMTRPIKVGANWEPARRGARKVTASLPAFSVSDNVRVHIAKSNLQLTRPDTEKTWEEYQALGQLTWSFLPEAWSMVFKSGEVSVEYVDETVITHFGWGATGHNFNAGIADPDDYIYGQFYQPWNTSFVAHTTYGPKGAVSLTGDFALGDWGVKACTEDNQALDDGFGAFTTWRIPTSAEYLFMFGMTANQTDATAESDTRFTKRLHKWGTGKINTGSETISGMFVLPDNYVDITGSFIEGNRNINNDRNLFTAEQWSLMEAAGVVFYPSAGIRSGYKAGVREYQTQFVAAFNYHSSAAPTPSSSANKAFSIGGGWDNSEVNPGGSSTSRTVGCTVRLIRVLN